jgi:hypothetical protein
MFWAGMLGVGSAGAAAVELTLAAVTVALEAETSGIELLLAPVVALEAETSGIELLLAPVAAALAAALELTDPDDGAKNVLQICWHCSKFDTVSLRAFPADLRPLERVNDSWAKAVEVPRTAAMMATDETFMVVDEAKVLREGGRQRVWKGARELRPKKKKKN